MTITKYGHSCLLIEENGVRIMTDPGEWSTIPDVSNVHAVVITHEHADHCSVPTLKKILEKNPEARVITHTSVGAVLQQAGISFETIEHEQVIDIKGISLQSFGTEHAVVYQTSPCRNTGYLIAGKLFAPGDALHDIPTTPIEVLALPTGGPWMKLSEAIDYAKKLAPKTVFPIHDAMYIESYQTGLIPRIVGGNLEAANITFTSLQTGETKDF